MRNTPFPTPAKPSVATTAASAPPISIGIEDSINIIQSGVLNRMPTSDSRCRCLRPFGVHLQRHHEVECRHEGDSLKRHCGSQPLRRDAHGQRQEDAGDRSD